MKYFSPDQKIHQIITNNKRFIKNLKRRKKRKKFRKQKKIPNRYLGIFSNLSGNSFSKHIYRSENHVYKIVIPKVFSLIDNPEETLETLGKIRSACFDLKIKELFINHRYCEKVDIGASVVLDVLLLELRKQCTRNKRKSKIWGRYSENEHVKEILNASGLPKHLGVTPESENMKLDKKYKPFNLYVGERIDSISENKSTMVEDASTKLTEYFDSLIESKGLKIDRKGKKKLGKLISEVLNNAEEHSNNKQWYVIGYMDQLNDKVGICNIALFDFGDSIHKSLTSCDLNDKIQTNIKSLIEQHTKKKFFEFGNNWTPENLWTLFALQEGVSRFNVGEKYFDRGNGSVDMIEFFLNLGRCFDNSVQPKMALISDKTYILFDGKYRLKEMDIKGEKRKIIAFNSANNLEERPDKKYIKNLENTNFPGTIIAMRFYLDEAYLSNN